MSIGLRRIRFAMTTIAVMAVALALAGALGAPVGVRTAFAETPGSVADEAARVEFSATSEVVLPLKQVFTSDDPSADRTFTYTMVAKNYTSQTPMPSGSDGDTYTFKLVGTVSDTLTLDMTGALDGSYVYLLQDASEHKPGYTYEARVYTVMVTVTNGQAVTVVERNDDGKKVSFVEFDPSYQHPVVPDNNASGSVKTGDDLVKIILPIVIIALGAGALVAVALFVRRRR